MSNDAIPDLVKVGFTLKDTELRAVELSHTGVPTRWLVEYEAYVFDPRGIEQKAHRLLQPYFYNKEYFKCPADVAIEAIKEVAESEIKYEEYKVFKNATDVEKSVEFMPQRYMGSWFDERLGLGRYEGYVIQGNKRHGRGIFIRDPIERNDASEFIGKVVLESQASFYFEGVKYVGEFKNDNFHGKGDLEKYGSKYEGQWQDGYRHGHGIQTFANGDQYVGEWNEGEEHGQGTLTRANGDKYVGGWQDGYHEGQGQLTDYDGDIYIGLWKDGSRSGYGIQSTISGSKYEGMWEHDLMHGKGVLILESGNCFEGTWEYINFYSGDLWSWGCEKQECCIGRPGKDFKIVSFEGHFTGVVSYIFADGNKYVGEWSDEFFHGHGKLNYASGDQYEGEFKQGMRHGHGVMIFENGNRIEGTWLDDEYQEPIKPY